MAKPRRYTPPYVTNLEAARPNFGQEQPSEHGTIAVNFVTTLNELAFPLHVRLMRILGVEKNINQPFGGEGACARLTQRRAIRHGSQMALKLASGAGDPFGVRMIANRLYEHSDRLLKVGRLLLG